MSGKKALSAILNDENLKQNIVFVQEIAGKEGNYISFPEDMDAKITGALEKRGIYALYGHQALAWQYAQHHQDFVVVTPTASGKTLTYNLPTLQAFLKDAQSRALYLFPTKALSQDQMTEFQELVNAAELPVKAFTFDGDTPSNARVAIRKQGNVVITNPDMLHQGILPHHTKWIQFFQNLKIIVIDEVHAYRGVFGSHLANLLRRLKRICEFYRADPLFIMCSATIANPQEHAEALIEKPVRLINESGAPLSPRTVILYNPPVINPELGIRASYIKQARALAKKLIEKDIQTIIFALSRLNVEVLTKYLKDDFEKSREAIAADEKIAGYRGGYLPGRRREIEKGVREGSIRGIVSTNALELGIDIGSLDAAILAGYPGSIASLWQQAGRAGRRGDETLAIFIGRSDPIDQFLLSHPEYLFAQSPEHARINPDNLMILVDHIKCASFELPFEESDHFGSVSPSNLKEILNFLTEGGLLHKSGKRWFWANDVYPAVNVNLRRIPEGNFVVVDVARQNEIIGEVEYSAAPMTIYPDAIYLMSGEQYIVDELDWDGRKAYVRSTDSDYFTDAIDYTNVKVLTEDEKRHSGKVEIFQGEVQVVTRAIGFKKIRFYTNENVGFGKINLPDIEMATTAYWFTIPEGLLDDLPWNRSDHIDGILGIAKALQTVAALHVMSEMHDIHRTVGDKSAEWFAMNTITQRGIYTPATEEAPSQKLRPEDLVQFQPTIFIYDNYPGGIGFSPKLYDAHDNLLELARDLIIQCGCEDGCPACVGPPTEAGRNGKAVARDILNLLIR
jgi:DEAD/DEAH box helicase domain-containing protein